MILRYLRERRRRKAASEPIPPEWEEILDRNVPYSRLLDDEAWQELLAHVRVLVSEKRFEGCNGVVITEEMRVTIAGWGAVLLLGLEPGTKTDYYPELHTILVYPAEFVVPVRRPIVEGSVAELSGQEVRLGESLGEGGPGTIVLSWEGICQSAGEGSDGVNVAIHELTHQLDQGDGAINGVPRIRDPALRARWASVFQSEYRRLGRDCERFEKGESTLEPLLDPYALTSAAEFFAVVMETFVERPIELEAEHPELYAVVREFFGQDPARLWRLAEAHDPAPPASP